MIPRKIVSGGANNNPAFLKASPNAKIPEPTLPLNRCIIVSRYLQLSNFTLLVHLIYSQLYAMCRKRNFNRYKDYGYTPQKEYEYLVYIFKYTKKKIYKAQISKIFEFCL